jgi:hypothetical protein
MKMTNQELQVAINTMFQNCLDSYKFGNSYAGTEFHKESMKQYRELIAEQLERAKYESSDRVS